MNESSEQFFVFVFFLSCVKCVCRKKGVVLVESVQTSEVN